MLGTMFIYTLKPRNLTPFSCKSDHNWNILYLEIFCSYRTELKNSELPQFRSLLNPISQLPSLIYQNILTTFTDSSVALILRSLEAFVLNFFFVIFKNLKYNFFTALLHL